MTLATDTPHLNAPAAAGATFDTLPLGAPQLANLATLGYLAMTPVQAASLPAALAGDDLIVQARTGTGKTVAFGLALLARLQTDAAETPTPVQALVLCPTRELADQVATEIRRLGRSADNLRVITLCGGVPLRGQTTQLAQGASVIVGTPGRVIDHLERGALGLGRLGLLVLDEADRMLDMGFVDDIGRIARRCPATRQTLLFSATYPEGIAALAGRWMRAPKQVTVRTKVPEAQIEQRFYEVREDERLHAVSLLLTHFRPARSLAFCNTRQQCRDLVAVLQAQGVVALALHGELEQRERDQVLVQFANRSCSVLVATDVAARGIDIAQLEAVINVDITPEPALHVHRIGRTGRADANGLALSLATLDEMGEVGRSSRCRARDGVVSARRPDAGAGGQTGAADGHAATGRRRKEKIRAGDILGALTVEAGYAADQIGKINVNDVSTYVAVDRRVAGQVLKWLENGRIKGRKVKARLLSD